jgi:hypothetical protein
MINLLPNQDKQEIQAARTNIILVNYIIFVVIAIMFLAVSYISTYSLLDSIKKSSENSIRNSNSTNSSLNVGVSIATAKGIFNRQLPYSDIIMGIGKSLPFGVEVDRISLNNDNLLTSPLQIDFRAISLRATPELVANLQKSPMFYEPSCRPAILSEGNSPNYPVLIPCTMQVHRKANL